MKSVFYSAGSRGHANHGWLQTYHTFSFASYYDPARMHFGMLRVVNDDTVAPGMGFGMHSHDNMEIITIPLSGTLEHKDSLGNSGTIRPGEIQAMSAGTGITHSEYNHSQTEEVALFQIWILPKVKNIEPRYEQRVFDLKEDQNTFQTIASPNTSDNALWINQDAFLALGSFDREQNAEYWIQNKNNGAFIMIVEGAAEIAGQNLEKRDALGIWGTEAISMQVRAGTEILVIDVPM